MSANPNRLLALALACTVIACAAPLDAQTLTYGCSTLPGSDCRSQIPDAKGNGVSIVPGTLTSRITVPPGACSGTVADIDLNYRYYHDWKGDLSFELDSPSGTPVNVGTGSLTDSGDDFDVTQPVFVTSFPSLSGQSPIGSWTLRVADRRSSGVGSLDDWTLSIVCQSANAVLPTVSIEAGVPTAGEIPRVAGTFVFTRSVIDSNPLVVQFTIAGSASGADYEAIPLTATIPANQSQVAVSIVPIADGIPEMPETVVATLLDLPAYDPGVPATATVLILDRAENAPVPFAGPFGLALLALAVSAVGAGLLRSRVR